MLVRAFRPWCDEYDCAPWPFIPAPHLTLHWTLPHILSPRRGRNTYGQLGTGDTEDRLDDADDELVTVDLGDSAALAISAGESHVCALLTDSAMKVKAAAK